MTTEKRKFEFNQQDKVGIVEESEFPIELALFPGCPGEDKMPKTSFVACPRRKVPVELVLFDLSPGIKETDPAELNMERNAAAGAGAGAANPARIEGEMVIRKRLTKSDINAGQSRLLLTSNCVRKHVLRFFAEDAVEEVENGGSIDVTVLDLDTGTEHRLRLKRWTSSSSFVLINGWSKEFVGRRGLEQGDEIALCWNMEDSMFYFSVLNRAPAY